MRYYPHLKLAEGIAEISKIIIHNKHYPVLHLNLRPLEYEAGGLTHQPQCSFRGAYKLFVVGLYSGLVTRCGEAN
jgi:hypothetical protein